MTTSEIVIIIITAFIAPYVIFLMVRCYLTPKLTAHYEHKEPMARRSSRSINKKPTGWRVYDFHFLVENEGRSKAEKVAAVVVEFWTDGGSGKLVKSEDFLPVPLRYTSEDGKDIEAVDVHPSRPYYWNIGDIYPPYAQEDWVKEVIFDDLGKEIEGHLFRLDLYKPPYNQAQALQKGTYGIKVVLYSENAKPAEILLTIRWSGNWTPKEREMLEKKIKIEKVQSFEKVQLSEKAQPSD
jgi:hypothetical protein